MKVKQKPEKYPHNIPGFYFWATQYARYPVFHSLHPPFRAVQLQGGYQFNRSGFGESFGEALKRA